MNRFLAHFILAVFFSFLLFIGVVSVQAQTDDSTLTNEAVVELVKSGLSESIIIAKIKGSKTKFDTSAKALVKIKEAGASDNVVLAMIDANSKASSEDNENSSAENQKTADIKEAVGKRKIFLITEDEESRMELIKKFTDKGFTFVDNKKSAELIFELSYAEGTTQQKTGILRGGNETQFKTKIGKLVVKLFQNSTEYLIYAREYNYAKAANMASVFGVSATPPSLRDQVKYYFVDDFLKNMKKAGDRFK